jgi:hypothetical protein
LAAHCGQTPPRSPTGYRGGRSKPNHSHTPIPKGSHFVVHIQTHISILQTVYQPPSKACGLPFLFRSLPPRRGCRKPREACQRCACAREPPSPHCPFTLRPLCPRRASLPERPRAQQPIPMGMAAISCLPCVDAFSATNTRTYAHIPEETKQKTARRRQRVYMGATNPSPWHAP